MGAALVKPWTVLDGTTQSRWQFGNATQYDLSLEKQVLQDVARGNLYALMTVYW